MDEDFEKMARDREEEARKISDLDVWISVVEKVVNLDVSPEEKAAILLQGIPDVGVVFGQLKIHYKNGKLSDKEYHDILERCVKKLESELGMRDFDPLKYNEQ